MPPDEPTEDNQQPLPDGSGTPFQPPAPSPDQTGSDNGVLPEAPAPAPAPDADQDGSDQAAPPAA